MQWTIIGGGIQGTTIALKLSQAGLDAKDLTIIDPYRTLCEQFNSYTHRISMPFLRSPFVHHIHPKPFHLKQYAKLNQYTGATYGPYKRPQHDMFMHHTHELIHQYRLNESHIQGAVRHIHRDNHQQWQLELNDGRILSTQYLIIAHGCNHRAYFPAMYHDQPDIQYIFDEEESQIKEQQTSHVVGSGISAAHLALKLVNNDDSKTVHLWLNKDIEIHDFDADPGWLGPKNMNAFLNIESSEERMRIIQTERHKGSMPHELYLRLKKKMSQCHLIIHKNEIEDIKNHHIITSNGKMYYDHILLATGFENTVMSQPMIQDLVLHFNAPIAQCGFPDITHELEWLPHLFVAGGLADLELGPFGRNIMGGREASERIYQAFIRLQKQLAS
ncbi:NAD(P)-binding domain-containing protein [Staphylococcus warneri]|uniref:NAD(P)-binding domain-containing protein n=1 Tax=Staphylococcus warneri TaxID=1292 RepID=UPI00066E2393|nr:NAD(P)-binding domain-containing protein [Staphylococcus warneri]